MAIEYTKAQEPKKSTAARKDVRRTTEAAHVASVADHKHGEVDGRTRALPAGAQALPVDTLPKPKMGRPRTGYIKAEYNRLYSADKRKADKLGLKVSEYRKMKGNEK